MSDGPDTKAPDAEERETRAKLAALEARLTEELIAFEGEHDLGLGIVDWDRRPTLVRLAAVFVYASRLTVEVTDEE